MNDVTRILSAIDHGEARAAEELLPLVYEELRRLAAQRLAQEKPGQTLQATALVHEAYLRLVGRQDPGWNGRSHFFAAAAEAMRRILIDRAQHKQTRKAGGDRRRLRHRRHRAGRGGGRRPLTRHGRGPPGNSEAEDPRKARAGQAPVLRRPHRGAGGRENALGVSTSTAEKDWAWPPGAGSGWRSTCAMSGQKP